MDGLDRYAQTIIEQTFTTAVSRDFLDVMCGKFLGRGAGRVVFQCQVAPEYAVKIEADGSFQNIIEWEVWGKVMDTPHARWFARCDSISHHGAVLVQELAVDLGVGQAPSRVPAYFTDLKTSNFGRIGRRVVCRDYGSNLLLQNGLTKRMRAANWWFDSQHQDPRDAQMESDAP